MIKNHKKRKNNEPRLWFSLFVGSGINIVFTCLWLLLVTKIAYESYDPRKLLLPLALLSLLVSGFGSGFFSAKLYRRQGASIGVMAGGLLCCLLIVLSLVVKSNGDALPWMRWGSYPLVILLATAGGMVGKEKSRKRRYYAK